MILSVWLWASVSVSLCTSLTSDIIHRSLTSAKVPSRLEPSGIYQSDGNRPDGITIVTWKRGKVLVWDAICPDTYTPSYISHAIREAGAVAQRAEHLQISKYAHLDSSHHFIPVAVETSGVFGLEALSFIKDLSRRLRQVTGEPTSLEYLLQRISVAVQHAGKCSCCSWDNGKVSWTGNFFWLNVHCIICLFVCFVVVFVSVFVFFFFFYIASSIVLSVLFFSSCAVIITLN